LSWPTRDWRALLALLGSIAGSAVLTAFVWWGVDMLRPDGAPWNPATERHRVETIRWVLWIAAGTIAVVIFGLGFAINRRSFRGSVGKDGVTMEMDGGEDHGPPPPHTPGDVPAPNFASYPKDPAK
jgi:hypothetical protein